LWVEVWVGWALRSGWVDWVEGKVGSVCVKEMQMFFVCGEVLYDKETWIRINFMNLDLRCGNGLRSGKRKLEGLKVTQRGPLVELIH